VTDPISITRVFEAPRERVWREFTEPHRLADWVVALLLPSRRAARCRLRRHARP
jgi:uncharacterized protein YndB with AHSA1/START domain